MSAVLRHLVVAAALIAGGALRASADQAPPQVHEHPAQDDHAAPANGSGEPGRAPHVALADGGGARLATAPAQAHQEATEDGGEPQTGGHEGHVMPAAAEQASPPLPPWIPVITDVDRAAAFPDLDGHALGDNAIRAYVLLDQLEWHEQDRAVGWNARGWVGRDRDRVWFRSEGERGRGAVESIALHGMYGRAFARWWDVVMGVRQDFRPGPAQTWAAIGLQGLAPYWFEVDATAYVGASWRTQARVELAYDMQLTNWVMLEPNVEIELHGKADPSRGIGAGLSSTNVGLRLRYEIRRELAPYAGVVWHRRYGGTADAAREAGDAASGAELVLGLRTWF